MRRETDIHERARGKWRDILISLGLTPATLSGNHGPCPLCGGKDRFRWDDKGGSGSFICTHCGAGSGVDLAMRWLNVDFVTARQEIDKYLPSAQFTLRKATRSAEGVKQWAARVWMDGNRLTGTDPASRYLEQRGLALSDYPSQLRYCSSLAYKHTDGARSRHPAMVAKFHSPDTKDWTLHLTYLTDDGHKANVEAVKKLAPMPVPTGGAVRLAPSAETMGIAEGIETALSAQQMFGIPVWAALSTGNLMKWRPPPTVKYVIVFSDCDESYAGQMAAYSLAYKLRGEHLGVEVRIPPHMGEDWNDLLRGERQMVAAE